MHEPSNMGLKLLNAPQRFLAWIKRLLDMEQAYPLRRSLFNAQRGHQHPATMSAARRRKLKRT